MTSGIRLVLYALQLVGITALTGCGDSVPPNDPPQARAAAPVRTVILHPGPFRDVIQLTGTVEALNDATLSARAGGTIFELDDLGTFVQAGDTVAQLDPTDAEAAIVLAEAQLASAKAQYELARANYDRGRLLEEDLAISEAALQELRSKLQQTEAAVEQAEAKLAQARQQLANTRVTTPFAGTVEQHFVDEGEQVSPGQQIARVVNTRRVRIRARVPERYINDIEVGAPVRLQFKAYDDVREDEAQVTFVGRTIDPQSRTFVVEVSKPNPEGLLKPEMVLRLWLTRDVIENALVVPRRAIVRDETGAGVFVVEHSDAGPTVRKRGIVTGADAPGRVVVQSGLEPGAEVVVTGQNDLAPGEPVEVVEVAGGRGNTEAEGRGNTAEEAATRVRP